VYIEEIASVGSSCRPLELGCQQEASLTGYTDRSIAVAIDYIAMVMRLYIAALEAGSWAVQ